MTNINLFPHFRNVKIARVYLVLVICSVCELIPLGPGRSSTVKSQNNSVGACRLPQQGETEVSLISVWTALNHLTLSHPPPHSAAGNGAKPASGVSKLKASVGNVTLKK